MMALIINEIFGSIQGEGINTGLPTVFIRLAGCDLRCKWCDTPYALSTKAGKQMEISEIINEVRTFHIDHVCVTGGEPLLQGDLSELMDGLIAEGYRIDLETNGARDISQISVKTVFISMDVKPPSSGEQGSFILENLYHLKESDQLKFIIKDHIDLEFAMTFIRMNKPICNLIMTPCDNSEGGMIVEDLMKYIKNDQHDSSILSKARVMIQTHKVIWPADQTGV